MKQARRCISLATVCIAILAAASTCVRNLNAELHKAVGEGDSRRVQHLVAEGADVNHQYGGLTPLMRAALRGDAEMARTLLEARADAGVVSPAGKTAFEYAVETGNQGVAYQIGIHQHIDKLQKEYQQSPLAASSPGTPLSLHNPNSKNVPVALEIWDLQEAEEAVEKGQFDDAERLIKSGRIFMVPNGTEVNVLERQLRISKVQIKGSGREGYVLNRLIR